MNNLVEHFPSMLAEVGWTFIYMAGPPHLTLLTESIAVVGLGQQPSHEFRGALKRFHCRIIHELAVALVVCLHFAVAAVFLTLQILKFCYLWPGSHF